MSGTGFKETSEIVRSSVVSRSTLTPVEDASLSSAAVPSECLRGRQAGQYVLIGEAGRIVYSETAPRGISTLLKLRHENDN